MHLLLLITAALSSQFTALSNDNPAFAVDVIKVNSNTATLITVTPPRAGDWENAVLVAFRLEDAAPELTAADTWNATTTSGDGFVLNAAFNFGTLLKADGETPIAEGDTIYVFVKHTPSGGEAAIPGHATIKYTDKWLMTCDAIDEDSYALTNVRIQGPKTAWVTTDNKIQLILHNEEIDFDNPPTIQFISDELTKGAIGWTVASLPFTGVPLDPDDGIWAYVQYDDSTGSRRSNEIAYEEEGIAIEVAQAVVKFTVTPLPDPILLTTDAVKLTFAPTSAVVWQTTGFEIEVTFTLTGVAPVTVTVPYADSKFEIAAFDMTQFGRRLAGDTLTMAVKYDVATATHTGGHALKVPVVKTLSGADPLATFAVSEPESINLATMFKFDVKVAQSDVTSNAAAWTGDVSLLFSKNKRALKPNTTDENWKPATKSTENSNGDVYTVAGVKTASLMPLANGDKVWVWVLHGKTPSAAGTVLDAPVSINVTGAVPPADFAVTPSPLNRALGTEQTITVKQNGQTPQNKWPANINLLFSLTETDPEEIELVVPVTGSGDVPDVQHKAEDFDLTQIEGIATASELFVYVHYIDAQDDDVYLYVPVKVTLSGEFPSVEESFVLDPNWMLWAANLTTTAAIAVTPNQTESWQTGASVLFTFPVPAAGSASNAGTKNVTIVKDDTTGVWSIPTATDLNDLAIPDPTDADAPVQVSLYTGTKLLAHKATFTVKKTAPGPLPEDITFTLAPNKMDFAEAMKTPEIEVKPGAGAKWPDVAKPGQLKATFKLTDKDDIVVDLAVTGETTKKYTIPKDVDLTPFGIKEADCPKVIKVHIKDGAVDLKHVADFTVNKPGSSAAMGVSPLLTLLAAALLLLVKLF